MPSDTRATAIKMGNFYDKCSGFSEECFGKTYPHFCPINDDILAECLHLKRGDELE